MSSADSISLVILTPEKTIVSKTVSKVSLPGTKGPFMVLRGHAPLISSLEEGQICFVSADVEEKVNIRSGFVEINQDNVVVCAEL